jgi:CDP-glycerol glycerophosphotransferase
VKKTNRYLKYFIIGSQYIIAYLISKPLKYIMRKKIWIISERKDEARDNSYHLFTYIRKNHPDLPIYYVIDFSSPDKYKISNLGNIIKFGSFKHYIYYMLAEILISTHIYGYAPDLKVFRKADLILKNEKKRVFLQHGILVNYIPILVKGVEQIDLFISGAKPEYNYIIEKLKYDKNTAKYTGLARFDNLINYKSKKQILIMPSWRGFLSKLSDDEFLETSYYKNYIKLIYNRRLINLLQNSNYKLVFFPHYQMQKYIHLFSLDKIDEIVIANRNNYDVQDLLKSSELLITDYSSVHFDFTYMKKPVLYFHFDDGHYEKGYFDYSLDGFGEICRSVDRLIDCIEESFTRNNICKKTYIKRSEKYFEFRDENNCKRIFDEILVLSNRSKS